jgi:exopolysaccharide biosynthesis protein
MAKKIILKRVGALWLAMTLFLPLLGAGAVGGNILGTTTFEWITQVAPGTTFYDFSIQTQSGDSQQGFVTEYKPSNMVSPVVAYGEGIFGKSDLNYVKNYLEEQGKNVVAGINGDFFSLETGVPLGLVINEGRLISSDDSRPAVGFLEDGAAFIGLPELTCGLYTENGLIPIEHVNKKRTAFGTYLLTNDFSQQTRNTTYGYDVFLKVTDTAPLQIGKPLSVVVERIETNGTSVAIPDGYFVLTVDANGPPERVSALQGLIPGQKATIKVETKDVRFEQAHYGVGGGEILLAGGQIQPQNSGAVHPRSALGIKGDGTVVLFEVDGRQSGYSRGLSLREEAEFLQDLGCVEAINLDGGGSSTFAVQYPGEDGANIVNSPSDSTPRKCANFLFLINNTTPTGVPQRLFLYPANYLVLAGSTVKWTPKATDLNYNSTPLPENINYTAPYSLGRITNEGVFTAAPQEQTGTIALWSDNAVGSKVIQVIDSPDEIRVVKKGTTDTLSSMLLKTGETIDLDILAYKNNKMLRSSIDAFEISLSTGIGNMDGNMTFTASDVEGKNGAITVAYKNMTQTISVSVGKAPQVVEDFENWDNNWSDVSETQRSGKVFYENKYDYVQYGKTSLGITYDFTGLLPEERAIFARPVSSGLVGWADFLNLWVYGDGSNNILFVQFEQGSATQLLDFIGWKLVSLPLPPGNKGKFIGFFVTETEGASAAGTIYIDQITASFGQRIIDETAPIIAEVQQGEETEQSLISVRISDPEGATLESKDITVWLDGKIANFAYDPLKELLRVPLLLGMQEGNHKITIEAIDTGGNIGRLSVSKVIGQNVFSTSFGDMEKHWSRSFVDFISQRGVVGGVVENAVAYFQPERPINRAEFAVVMTRYLGLNQEDFAAVEVPFADMESIPGWAVNYVKAMYAKGIIVGRGVGEGKVVFDPLAPVTRTEAATMIGKTLQKGYASTPFIFKDQKSIPIWGAPYVKVLSSLGVISGYEDGSFRPSNNVKRAEVAKMIYSLY